MNKKGQLNFIIGFISFFVALTVVAILMAPIIAVIEIGVNATAGSENGALTALVMNLYPVMIVLVLLIILFVLATRP